MPCRPTLWAAALSLGAVLLLPGAVARAGDAWLDLVRPAPGEVAGGSVPLLEVSGRAGRGTRQLFDVVVAVDVSESTLYPSGFDVNGDGVVGVLKGRGVRWPSGRYRPHRSWTTDPGDTIVRAELTMARRIVTRLRDDGARVGLVAFSGRAHLLAPVGDPEEALQALDEIRVHLDRSGTNLSAAMRVATRALVRAPRAGKLRERVLMILSDGLATAPGLRVHAIQLARRAADRAMRAGVRIYGMALGGYSAEATPFRELVVRTGGEFLAVSEPGEVLEVAPQIELLSLGAVDITNRTNNARARAVRFFADGSFDGFVPVVPGENRLRVVARTVDGSEVRVDRTVFFESGPPSDSDRNLVRSLRDRTVETELISESRLGRRPRKTLSVTVNR